MTIQLMPKQQVCVDGLFYQVIRRDGEGNWVLEHVKTRAPHSLSDAQIVQMLSNGKLSFVRPDEEVREGFDPQIFDFTLLPEGLQAETRRRLDYVRAAEQRGLPRSAPYMPTVIADVAERLGDPRPPSPSTLCRWLKTWDESGGHDVRALVPKYLSRGNRTQRKPHEVIEAVEDSIEAIYLRREKMTMREAWKNACNIITDKNQRRPEQDQLPKPSERMISRKVSEIDKYELKKARDGKAAADQEYRPIGASPRATRPLEIVEMDHHKLDIILVDKNGLPYDRPWLTAAIDSYSRVITGFHIGFEAPNTMSVGSALRLAILSKDDVLEKFPDIKHAWPCYGVPEKLLVDNGTEFHASTFDDACFQLGIDLQYCPVKSPWFKGKIERFFGTVAKWCHQLPGTTFSNVVDRGDYQSEKKAIFCLDEFVELFHGWLVDYYHQKVHVGINDAPIHRWQEGVATHPVRLPNHHGDLDALLGRVEVRTLSRRGIELHRLLYNSECVKHIRTRPGAPDKVKVRFDPSNLGRVLVADPVTGTFIKIPTIYPEYAEGMTLDQHKVILEHAKQRNEGRISIEELCRSRDVLFKAEERAAAANRRRLRNGRAQHQDTNASTDSADRRIQTAEEFMGDLPDALRNGKVASALPTAAPPLRESYRSDNPGHTAENRGINESSVEWEQDDDDLINPTELGIEVLPRR